MVGEIKALTDEGLLDRILNGDVTPAEKAQAVLVVRQNRLGMRQQSLLMLIAVIAAIAASVEAVAAWRQSQCGCTLQEAPARQDHR